MDRVQEWAQGTLACGEWAKCSVHLGACNPVPRRSPISCLAGVLGASYGVLTGFINGQSMLFFAAAYGSNTILISGTVLGLRAVSVAALPPALTEDARWVTGASAAAVGAGVAAFMTKASKVPRGAAAFGAAGWLGQHGVDAVNAWRAEQATLLGPPGAGQANEGALRSHSSASSQPGAATHSAAAAGPVGGRSDDAPDPWAWLPFALGKADADTRRLKKLRARLADIDERLGNTDVTGRVDPRVRALECQARDGAENGHSTGAIVS